jgi:hypothetical protein
VAVVNVRSTLGTATEARSLEEVLGWIDRGELRVPTFGRPFVWGPDQRLSLFDSVERGLPIGNVLVLDTREDLRGSAEFAGAPLPGVPKNGTVSYLLDGHQRLATLYGGMRQRSRERSEDPGDAPWRVYRELGLPNGKDDQCRYRLLGFGESVPSHFLPMSSVFRTLDFLAFVRGLDTHRDRLPVDDLVEEAEEVAQRFKSYKLPVVRLRGGDLRTAMDVFRRINQGGQPLTEAEIRRADP